MKNLVANAVKFTPAGRVHAEALWDDELLTVRVEDTGIGIPEYEQVAIFEMFRQVDGSSTRRFAGVGLGLHIARRLTEVLGGQVRIESTVGVGSTCTGSIPCPRTMPEKRLRAGAGVASTATRSTVAAAAAWASLGTDRVDVRRRFVAGCERPLWGTRESVPLASGRPSPKARTVALHRVALAKEGGAVSLFAVCEVI